MDEARERTLDGSEGTNDGTSHVHCEAIGEVSCTVESAALGAGKRTQIAALDELEHEIRAVIVIADREKGDHVGVADTGEEPPFFAKRAHLVGLEVP